VNGLPMDRLVTGDRTVDDDVTASSPWQSCRPGRCQTATRRLRGRSPAGGQHLPTVGLVVATVDPLYGTGGQAVWPSDHESAPEDLGRLHCHLGHLEHIGGRPAQCHDPVVAEVVSRGALPSSARWASIPS